MRHVRWFSVVVYCLPTVSVTFLKRTWGSAETRAHIKTYIRNTQTLESVLRLRFLGRRRKRRRRRRRKHLQKKTFAEQ